MQVFHKHKWLAWSELVTTYGGTKMQLRACSECGKVKKRSLGYCDGLNADLANKALEKTK